MTKPTNGERLATIEALLTAHCESTALALQSKPLPWAA